MSVEHPQPSVSSPDPGIESPSGPAEVPLRRRRAGRSSKARAEESPSAVNALPLPSEVPGSVRDPSVAGPAPAEESGTQAPGPLVAQTESVPPGSVGGEEAAELADVVEAVPEPAGIRRGRRRRRFGARWRDGHGKGLRAAGASASARPGGRSDRQSRGRAGPRPSQPGRPQLPGRQRPAPGAYRALGTSPAAGRDDRRRAPPRSAEMLGGYEPLESSPEAGYRALGRTPRARGRAGSLGATRARSSRPRSARLFTEYRALGRGAPGSDAGAAGRPPAGGRRPQDGRPGGQGASDGRNGGRRGRRRSRSRGQPPRGPEA